jgi:hypothetical protein
MKTSDIKRLGEAWLKVTSGESLEEKKKLDPVDDKANDKKFKDRKDKDIDNDGDVDSSDEYLHKRRAATDDAIDGGKKPAKNEGKRGFIKAAKDAKAKGEKDFVFAGKKYNVESALKEEEDENGDEPKKKKPFPPKKDGEEKDSEEGEESEEEDEESEEEDEEEKEMPKVAGKKNDKKKVTSTAKTPEISKIGEDLDLVDAIKDLHQMWESAAKQQKSNATKPEEIDSKDSPKAKEFTSAHKGKSEKKYEDDEEDGHTKTFKAQGGTKPKSGKRPQDNQAGDTNVVKSTEAPAKNIKEGAVVVDANAQEGSVSLVDMAREQLAGNIKNGKEEKEKNPFDARTKKAKEFLERMARRR